MLRSLPVAIQGAWVGLACIVLLVGSAAALRSLFVGNVGAAPSKPALTATASASAVSAAPVASASAPLAASASSSSSGGLNIGGPGTAPGLGGFGALSIRDRLPAHVRLRKIGLFLDDLERLLDIEPSAIDRPDVRKLIADAATFAMAPTLAGTVSPDAERIFTFLTTGRAGAAGPDILFDLVTTRGGSRASTYAEEMLRRDDVRARGTPALRVAWEFRAAPTCQAKVALFDRVRAEGDKRVLATLFQMGRCGKGPTDCCLTNDPAFKEVLRTINSNK